MAQVRRGKEIDFEQENKDNYLGDRGRDFGSCAVYVALEYVLVWRKVGSVLGICQHYTQW